MSASEPRYLPLMAKTIVSHTITYFIMGALAAHFLNYAALMSNSNSGYRPLTSTIVIAGPLFQPLRGIIFASVFWPLRSCLFGRRGGWLVMAWMLIAVGILSTFGAAPGSVEGMVYTPVPVFLQMRGWLEVVPQAALFSALLCYWVNRPGSKWLNWTLGVTFFLLMGMDLLGVVMHKG